VLSFVVTPEWVSGGDAAAGTWDYSVAGTTIGRFMMEVSLNTIEVSLSWIAIGS
jgi:hypothetical protein